MAANENKILNFCNKLSDFSNKIVRFFNSIDNTKLFNKSNKFKNFLSQLLKFCPFLLILPNFVFLVCIIVFSLITVSKKQYYYFYSVIRLYLKAFLFISAIYLFLKLFKSLLNSVSNSKTMPDFLQLLMRALINIPIIFYFTIHIAYCSSLARLLYMIKCNGNNPSEWWINSMFNIIFISIILLVFVISILYNKYCNQNAHTMMLIRTLFIISIMYFIILLSINSFEEIVANTIFDVTNKNQVDDCEEKEDNDSALKKIFNYILLVFIVLFLIASIILHSIPHPAVLRFNGELANRIDTGLGQWEIVVGS